MNEELLSLVLKSLSSVSESASNSLNEQESAILKLSKANKDLREKVTNDFFTIASLLNKNKLVNYGTQLEQAIVDNLLEAPYDAKSAFKLHKAFFTERHEMAMFILENISTLKKIVERKRENAANVEIVGKPKVFTYWHSDTDLPLIIHLCRESMKQNISDDMELIILNDQNYKQWIDYDLDSIKPLVSKAHFTDFLRLRLLEKWGGFWIDATCMLTEDFYKATQEIRKQEQFLYAYINSRVGSWFIWSKPSNYVTMMIIEVLTFWWAKKNRLTNYFMIHDIIEMLYWVDEEYRKDWDKMLKIHPKNALALLRAYNQELSDDNFDKLSADSFVHKLTYKYDASKIIANSALERLLKFNKS